MPLANRLLGGGIILAASGMILYHLSDNNWLSLSWTYKAMITGIAAGAAYAFIKLNKRS